MDSKLVYFLILGLFAIAFAAFFFRIERSGTFLKNFEKKTRNQKFWWYAVLVVLILIFLRFVLRIALG